MVFRWAAESLNLPKPFGSGVPPPPPLGTPAGVSPASPATPPLIVNSPGTQDISSFVASKNPRSDVQFAAAVAYYNQFLAPPAERQTALTPEILKDAFRKVGGRRIPPHPEMTLNNAYQSGLLDRKDKGTYVINSVGENLVTMTLPGDGARNLKKSKKKKRKSKKPAKKMPVKAKA